MANKVRPLNQEDWKRSQIRMPQEEYDRIIRYAELKKMSLNTAILALTDAALDIEENDLGLNSKVQTEDSKNSSGIGMKKVLPVRTQIRIPPELHTRLVEEAHKNESSLNDAMIFYIEKGFSPSDSISANLKSKLEQEAAKNNRLLSDEINLRLEKSFENDYNKHIALNLAGQVEAFDELTEKLNNVINSLIKKLDEQQKYIETLKKTK